MARCAIGRRALPVGWVGGCRFLEMDRRLVIDRRCPFGGEERAATLAFPQVALAGRGREAGSYCSAAVASLVRWQPSVPRRLPRTIPTTVCIAAAHFLPLTYSGVPSSQPECAPSWEKSFAHSQMPKCRMQQQMAFHASHGRRWRTTSLLDHGITRFAAGRSSKTVRQYLRLPSRMAAPSSARVMGERWLKSVYRKLRQDSKDLGSRDEPSDSGRCA